MPSRLALMSAVATGVVALPASAALLPDARWGGSDRLPSGIGSEVSDLRLGPRGALNVGLARHDGTIGLRRGTGGTWSRVRVSGLGDASTLVNDRGDMLAAPTVGDWALVSGATGAVQRFAPPFDQVGAALGPDGAVGNVAPDAGGTRLLAAYRAPASSTWDATAVLSDRATTSDFVLNRLAIGSGGRAVVAWGEVTDTGATTLFTARRQPDGSWSSGTALVTPRDAHGPQRVHDVQLDLDTAGNATLVWAALRPDERVDVGHATLSDSTGAWTIGAPLGRATRLSEIALDVNGRGDAVVAWADEGPTSQPGDDSVRARRRSGDVWGVVETLARGPIATLGPVAALNAHGDAVVGWGRVPADGITIPQVAAATAGQPWERPSDLSRPNIVNPVPRFVAIDDDGRVVASWANRISERSVTARPLEAGPVPRITELTAPPISAQGGVLWLNVGVSAGVERKYLEVQQLLRGRWVTIERARRSGSPGAGIAASGRPIGGGVQTFRVLLRAQRTSVSRPVTVRLARLPSPPTPICRTPRIATMIAGLAWVACTTDTGSQMRAYDLIARRAIGTPINVDADIVDFTGDRSTLWLLGPRSILPVDLRTRTVGQPLALPDTDHTTGDSIEVQGSRLWVLQTTRTDPLGERIEGQRLVQVDPVTGATGRRIDLPAVDPDDELVEPWGILVGRQAVFVPRRNDLEGFRRVFRIDSNSGTLTTLTGGHAVGQGPAGVWVANDRFVRLDVLGRPRGPRLGRDFFERLGIGTNRIWAMTRRIGVSHIRVLYSTFDAQTGRMLHGLRPIGPDIPDPLGAPSPGTLLLTRGNEAFALSTTFAAIWRLP